ncbi:MAG TPA: cytochrome c [Thermoanaerobaculia bacterium]|nr:cytochrome c [Thermoanaerobaculia bacterium]
MKILATVLALAALTAVVVLSVAHCGVADVAATTPHAGPVEWFLVAARDSAVERGARGLAPPAFDDPLLLRKGATLYHRQCALCHGAPGFDPAPLALGLNPLPPELHLATRGGGDERAASAARTFWITKHGLKMTGMPAFGVAFEDDELWAVTAVVERLPELTAGEYAAMVRAAGTPATPGTSAAP